MKRMSALVGVAALVLGLAAVAITAAGEPAAAATGLDLYASVNGTETMPCTNPAAPCRLRVAAREANQDSGDTIHIANGTYSYFSLSSNELDSAVSDQTWIGESQSGVILTTESGESNPVLRVQAGAMTMRNMTFRDTQAGALFNSATLTVDHVSFINNAISDGGSAINSPVNGTVTVLNSTFSGNHAFVSGGAIESGEFPGVRADLVVRNSTFDNNTSFLGGGAINAGSGGGTANTTIVGSTFSHNTAQGHGFGGGGAIQTGGYFYNSSTDVLTIGTTTLTVANSTFDDNTANYGGAISERYSASRTSVVASTFVGNTVGGNDAQATAIYAGDPFTFNGKQFPMDTQVTVAANVFADSSSCAQHESDWTDAGYNVGADSSCFNGGSGNHTDSGLAGELGPLAHNGGPTQTVELLDGNPAIADVPLTAGTVPQADATSYSLCPVVADQRGLASPPGVPCNSGSVQSPRVVSVTVTGSQTYGSSAPTFTTVTPPPASDTFTGTITCTTQGDPAVPIAPTLPAGTYSINGDSCSGLSISGPTAGGYLIDYTGSTFTVNPAPLTVNAPSTSMPYGSVPTGFTPSYSGLVNGQTAPAAPATCTTTASGTSPPGQYPITCSGAVDPNYTISYGPAGTLTVLKAPTATTVTGAPPTPTVNQAVTLTATVTYQGIGIAPTGTVTFYEGVRPIGTAPLTPAGTATLLTTFGGGDHEITAGYNGDDNYLASLSTNAAQESVSCTRTVSGSTGAIVVSSGITCVMPGTHVSGGIVVTGSGVLDLEGATVAGSLSVNGAAGVRICGTTTGAIAIAHVSGFVLVGDPADNCPGNRINGSVSVINNRGGVVVGGNTYTGGFQVYGNTGAGPLPGETGQVVYGNTKI